MKSTRYPYGNAKRGGSSSAIHVHGQDSPRKCSAQAKPTANRSQSAFPVMSNHRGSQANFSVSTHFVLILRL